MEAFTEEVIDIIRNIPRGKVTSYGRIATMAGNPRGARQVSRILHSMSRKYSLPWYRVVNSKGSISILDPDGANFQRKLLISEGVLVSEKLSIDLDKYLWDIVM